MLVAFARNIWRYGRYLARQMVKHKPKVPTTLNTFRYLSNELERQTHVRRHLDWMTYRSGALEVFSAETAGMKLTSVERAGDFCKVDQGNFCHALSTPETEAEFFSLDDISISESVILGGEPERVLIPNRMVNMLGFINNKLENNSPALSENLSTE